MAVPPGSSTPALRFGSGRGPTLRTAPRGATSERMEHATGSICPGRVITRINDAEGERAPRTPPLPNRPNCRRFQEAPERSRYERDAPPRYRRPEISQVPDFLRFTQLLVGSMWRAKSRSLSHQHRSDTYCGNVNPHPRTQVDAASGLQTHLYVPVRGFLVAPAEQRSRRARREPPPDQEVLGAQRLHDRAEPAAEVADLGCPLAQKGHQGTGSGRGAEKMSERVGALRKLDRFHARLVEEHPALEDVHRRRLQPGPGATEPAAAIGGLSFHHRGRRLARQARGVEQVVVGQESDRRGPLEGGKRRFHRAAGHVVERQKPGRLVGPKQQMSEPLGAIEEGSDGKSSRRGHEQKLKTRLEY